MIGNRTFITSVFILLAALVLAGCAESTPLPSPTSLPPTETLEPNPTDTTVPTDTPEPSPTPVPPTTTPEPTETEVIIPIAVEDILGIWFASESVIPQYTLIGDDGVMRAYNNLTDIEKDAPFALQNYMFDGDIITFDGILGCDRGVTGQYHVSTPEPGKLQFELVSDTCTGRVNGLNGILFTLVPNETTTTNPITVEDIVGLWFAAEHDIPHYIQFAENGSLRAAETLEDVNNGLYFARDEFVLEGDLVTITGGPGVCNGITGQYQVTLVGDGKIQFKMIRDTCENRIGGVNGTLYTFVRE